ncbi:tRNA(fMet)-specific endonuclease VapC [Methylobacterium brachiatum]|jgi:tRNA(fMet)-specific endonuclease VapC|uniref:Ribonuclease VapC n=1 Tax=Methylobacterium brachiatum TaxID=269660 RepID=A0AAJ1TQK5_9HYPH|nr:type II toxin-antitoxin system VapC family toxin [Methylobacterium brachiatum]MCB4804029.1 type II toxin-antitoxin system VapC family toxin [Methylobacterium brachiatum]MDQ0542841.1 tRNA(fMet)-specific endonuclease VapC [Methylobacterium brachiatum]
MRYLLDTNILSAMVRSPRGPVAEQVRRVGETEIYTSVVVAAELRYGALRKGSDRLTRQVEAVLGAVSLEPWRVPYDAIYANLRLGLERAGTPIGANDLLIATQALADGSVLVTDNTREFARISGLAIENWVRP